MPLKENEVDTSIPFTREELLYRRVEPSELNSKGEVDPTRINACGFKRELESAPSVMRSKFCEPNDVLHVLCAERDTTGWLVFYVSVGSLPEALKAGDNRCFDFFPMHVPKENCGAHSVVACCESGDSARVYVKPSQKVIYDFKAKFATALQRV